MKGHVGGGPVTWSLWVQGRLVKAKPFVCLKTQYTNCDFVQERLPEMPVLLRVFPRGSIVHQLESLILAQNERWRHA